MDGPYAVESVVSAADAIAELWRFLARATRGSGEALAQPSTVYSVIGHLVTAARSAEQVFDQFADWVRGLEADADLAHDEAPADQHFAVDSAEEVFRWFARASFDVAELERHLHEVHAELSHLYIARETGEGQR
ncbi:hypothetical protein [Nocardia otitidiscaviarum]|uniref:hypothetical protein n=1 Tax=Nocardia otitidiscaviarum TaxID=1823 RepID=UPI002458D37A|nr:hypothetical protein [Nocardia otitidiscaviarum]